MPCGVSRKLAGSVSKLLVYKILTKFKKLYLMDDVNLLTAHHINCIVLVIVVSFVHVSGY